LSNADYILVEEKIGKYDYHEKIDLSKFISSGGLKTIRENMVDRNTGRSVFYNQI